MDPRTTALVLIGYQNDYFAEDGILHGVIESSTQSVLKHTIDLIKALEKTDAMIITTPINFTPDYSELIDPVGILQVIKDAGAFKAKTSGAGTIPEILAFGDRIIEVPGKRGLNAFASTDLDKLLQNRGITTIALAGAITSICIDSTGRAAFEKGYKVVQLSDCISSRTSLEESFYCSTVFPLYASVMDSRAFLRGLDMRKQGTPRKARQGAKPKQAAKPRQGAKPKQAAKPRQSAKPKQATKPRQSAKPKQATKPRQSAKPKQAAKPRQNAKPKQAAKPRQSAKPKQAAKPRRGSTTGRGAPARQRVAARRSV